MNYRVIVPKRKSLIDHTVSLTKLIRSARVDWCVENIGKEEVDWRLGETLADGKEFLFLREEDATMFALRWL